MHKNLNISKLAFAISFFLITTSTAFCQSFEGKIIYENKYKSKIPNVTDQQLNSMMGTTQEYFIKGANYKSILNGTVFQWQLYISKENRLYSKMSNSEIIYWNDASIQGDEVLNVKINKAVTKVMGYTCDEVILECKSGIQKYYFNSKFYVDPNLFTSHKYGNWSDFISKSKSLPLKSIVENSQFTIENIAIEVIPMQLDSSFFDLPQGAKTEKMPN